MQDLVFLALCRPSLTFVIHRGRHNTAYEMRIISLLPSLTEIVAALGLGDSIVGLTHSCDYPRETVDGKVVVTSTEISPYTMSQEEIHKMVSGSLANGHSLYGLDAALIEAADADVILTQALCDVCAVSYPKVISTCAKVLAGDDSRPRVISIEPTTFEEVMNTIVQARAADASALARGCLGCEHGGPERGGPGWTTATGSAPDATP